ncbi:Putative uncharacterized protein yrbG [Lactobacillus equicursoris DSM 19284 = JCM 14600 = CIP 110162]|uniref:Uncharacterized protein n=1 Tax=Lactobacillus equicursoris DSM 19284 = JCM 14600 = CIP 110162 TaxID=1293597 RepID=K0NUL1_9LACO|nr:MULTISPECIES: hypothetical protein [Lactobacillus]KRL03505.1 hypothetical protein FC20_GL000993 [Lactobacillus equicursoris DSM 19284 = JCM 14600 = CIP 110162]MDD6386541.1 hypothetical protein [Lactobacillus equicursoris]TXG06623.1 hypothetical protein FU323_06920 [Lactobacillus delbrueckii subsp. bulgaricus]CCK86169.1 Putative uncharacterized protein yrbG [Lactobacillus equicursoris DSM 19284 = JCM 14600 = CIP 110162]
MIKSFKLLSLSLLSVTIVAMLMSAQNVGAATNNTENTTVSSIESNNTSKNTLTDSEIDDLDDYVEVKNNQYVLNVPSSSNLSEQEIKVAKAVIEESNRNIQKNNLSIDPVTKEASETSSQNVVFNTKFRVLARAKAKKKAKSYTFKNFWWGSRYYFRSNKAIDQMEHELESKAMSVELIGALASIVSSGYASAIGTVGSVYFSKIRSDLDGMHKKHPHSSLYMDINYSGVYKIKVLK